MIVRDILKSKSSGDVATTMADKTVAEAAHDLHQRRIGALVVVDAGQRIAGIISERDVVRGLAQHGEKVLGLRVRDLMTANVLVCRPDDALESLMETMTDNRVRHLPVVAGERLAGIITIGDVVKARLEEAQMEMDQMREYVSAAH